MRSKASAVTVAVSATRTEVPGVASSTVSNDDPVLGRAAGAGAGLDQALEQDVDRDERRRLDRGWPCPSGRRRRRPAARGEQGHAAQLAGPQHGSPSSFL
jgi:hypothetical protein